MSEDREEREPTKREIDERIPVSRHEFLALQFRVKMLEAKLEDREQKVDDRQPEEDNLWK